MASAFFQRNRKGHIRVYTFTTNRIFKEHNPTKRISKQVKKMVAASNPFALIKNKHKYSFLLKISWLLEMHLSTRDACCTLYCWRMVKPLFYRLYEVETVDLRFESRL